MNNTIYCCEVVDLSDNSALAEEFFPAQGYDFSSQLDVETGVLKHIIYFEDQESANSAALNLKSLNPVWSDMGLQFSTPGVFSIEKKEWSEIWKKYFKIQHVSARVVIKPTWLEYIPSDDCEIIVELDPGMSFGTGRHATTRFCIKMLDELTATLLTDFSYNSDIQQQDVKTLDAGCGSGILTIAAYKLGLRDITAFDNDPGCIACSEENLVLNNIDPASINLKHCTLAKADTNLKYDIVIANIMAHILLENKKILKALMKPDGYLILAGILTDEYCEVRRKFEELDLKEIKSLTEDEWTGGLFRYKKI